MAIMHPGLTINRFHVKQSTAQVISKPVTINIETCLKLCQLNVKYKYKKAFEEDAYHPLLNICALIATRYQQQRGVLK